MNEIELEGGRVKALSYKVKGISRESPSQKGSNVVETDLRNHWSTATNTKEWILLQLDEPCLLSHIRIYNKSVLEWEISLGLRYKPETFIKARPRCEAPRRDMVYPMNYTPCRYVRISCLRGNPIAIFFIQLIGVPVIGLEPEFQPVVNHLLPHITSHKQDAEEDIHLKLLQDLTNRLTTFLPLLETDLNSFPDAPETTLRFLAMLAGPFYPILHILNERESIKSSNSALEIEASKSSLPSPALTVSSNFEPRRSRNTISTFSHTTTPTVFRPDAILLLLRKAYKDSQLGTVCTTASRVLLKLEHPNIHEGTVDDKDPSSESFRALQTTDYSNLFGEEFRVTDDHHWDIRYLQLLDIKAVEEGILHILFACASQPLLCSKLAGNSSEFWSTLPLIQALLPALRPNFSSSGQVDDTFSAWRQPFVQHALSQVVVTSTSPLFRQLLHGCAGYLSSFSPSHVKAACVLIDLCTGVLGPWIGQVIAKMDLAVELIEDLLGVIHGARPTIIADARAALKYIILALSGHMDDVMSKYKDVKHQILFLLEILDPFLDPALTPLKSMIAFGNVSPKFHDNQEQNCTVALNIIKKAVTKSAILPSMEFEWRRGSVAPIVLLSILEPHMHLPPNVELGKPQRPDVSLNEADASKIIDQDDSDDVKLETFDDVSILFAPPEVRDMVLMCGSNVPDQTTSDPNNSEEKQLVEKKVANVEYSELHAECLHLMKFADCELWATEFRQVASDLHSQSDIITPEGHNAALDALLLAAECYVNPFFMMSFKEDPKLINENNYSFTEIRTILEKSDSNLETIANIEKKRDIIVLEILLEAAELDYEYQKTAPDNDESNDVMQFSVQDLSSMDAITLVRQNQALLCKFLITSLLKEQHMKREILLQSLVFLLQSATKLYCSSEQIIEIILSSAEYLNDLLVSYCHQGILKLELVKVHEVERHWILLQRLVVASSGGEGRFSNLVPPSAWLRKISSFSCSSSPLVRFIGWMAINRNAKHYQKERLVLASDLSELTTLLSIFSDEMAVVNEIVDQKDESFRVVYPEISQFFPNLKRQFKAFGEAILEAVGLQLKVLPSSAVPDLLCWFSDICSWPFLQKEEASRRSLFVKGFLAKNAKAIILYILEAVISEHMEAMVPEMPRVVQVLQSLCTTSYADVAFLDSVLGLLKPLITYSLKKASNEENLDFESLCFDELFSNISNRSENQVTYCRAPTILVLASVFLDLSSRRKQEILQSLVFWADFATFEPTTSFHDYLSAFQVVMESCKTLLIERLQVSGIIPIDGNSESHSLFLIDAFQSHIENQNHHQLSVEEIAEFSKNLEILISKLNPTIELCWKLHFQPAKKLTVTLAQCFVYSRCLSSVLDKDSVSDTSLDNFYWKTSLEQLAEKVFSLQENSCWEVASTVIDCILDGPRFLGFDKVIGPLCLAMKKFSHNAPKVSWRLQTDKWLSSLFNGNIQSLLESLLPLVDLLSSMMSHIEPEQRFTAVKHLGQLVSQEADSETIIEQNNSCDKSILSSIVSNTWDRIIVLASSDMSPLLRTHALALLVKCVPFAERPQLQSVLGAADNFLPCLVNLGQQTCEGPFMQLSLALIATICLYSPVEDVSLIPQNIWRNIETLGLSKAGKHEDLVQSACRALCKLKSEGDEAKGILKGVLASNIPKQEDSDFESTRESLLQVLANLTSVQSYFDFFSKKTDEKLMEIQEAEIELDLTRKEQYVIESSNNDLTDWRKLPFLQSYGKEDKRLQEIKDEIESLEMAKLKEEIVARRQKKLLVRRARQKHLEEIALREAELLQELDRERAAEMENEIERQKLLAVERAKTSELQHNLDMEKEKRTQRELQRELEQAESGIRPGSRREFSSNSTRPRERYRERDNGRPTNDLTNPSSSSMPSIVVAGSRQYAGQAPTLLQARDEGDEENFEGSRDSGDTGSLGEADLVMALEGQCGQRRGNKSRQMRERREGKWERRH